MSYWQARLARVESNDTNNIPALDVDPVSVDAPTCWKGICVRTHIPFVIAGSGEAQEGHASYRERTIRYRETGPDAMREKAKYVLGEMERRMAALGFTWTDTTAAQVYTVHDLHPFLADDIVKRGAARHGLTWHFCRPPVVDLEYEMDCRGIESELAI